VGLGPPLDLRGVAPRGLGQRGLGTDYLCLDAKQVKVLLVPVKIHFTGSERYHFGWGYSRVVRAYP
jgi:hypothetical protein